jgi:hypothetical protein
MVIAQLPFTALLVRPWDALLRSHIIGVFRLAIVEGIFPFLVIQLGAAKASHRFHSECPKAAK